MNFTAIRKWYTGKALGIVDSLVIPTLVQAAADGYWPAGASRRVKAALNKQSVAVKFAKANSRPGNHRRAEEAPFEEGLLEDVVEDRSAYYEGEHRGWELVHVMRFGCFQAAPEALGTCVKLRTATTCAAEKTALATAHQWALDFLPVACLVEALENARPRPTFVMGTLSPTVAKTLTGMGMTLRPETVAVPWVKWERVERVSPKGQKYSIEIGTVIWPHDKCSAHCGDCGNAGKPSGTRHGKSRFVAGTAHNSQCHACGHAIKDPFNWVPLYMLDEQNVAHSMWVGRDCARKIFGVVVTGDAEYKERS
jgi:hypothetical protein